MSARAAVILRRTFDLLASLRVGVVAMVVLAVACGIATFYESSHGTAAAQRVFYQTRWFTLLLGLLALNILLSMLRRYPWSRHQAGFVMAHVGIVLLLVGSLVSLHFGLDGAVALYEGQGTRSVALRERALEVDLAGRHETFAAFASRLPEPGRPVVFPIAGTPVRLVAEAYAPHVEVAETIEAAEAGGPALAFVLAGEFGPQAGWLLAGGERGHVHFGPLHLGLVAADSEEEAQAAFAPTEGGSQIVFVIGPDGRQRYAIGDGQRAATVGTFSPGHVVTTPWMGLSLTVERVLGHAAARRTVTPAPAPDAEDRRLPAVRVRFDSPAGGTASEWLPWGESLGTLLAEGRASVAFGERQAPLPFRMTLLDFTASHYPGSRRPAAYESRVRVEDAGGGSSEHVISMNNPLHRDGYVFFQASFVEGDPMMSILSVSRSPGLPLVYLGTTLVSLGVGWMFYVKPWLARRQARRAAHRRQPWRAGTAEVRS